MLLTDSDQLTSLGLVVLDEVHYLQDPFRGGVWEEVLILTPSRYASSPCQRPSATPIPRRLVDEVRGPTTMSWKEIVRSISHNHFAVVSRGQPTAEILDLLDGSRLSDDAAQSTAS